MATMTDIMNGEDAQRPRKLFVQMSGAPGSGKSTLANLLQQSLGGLVIDHDIIRSSLLEDNTIAFYQAARSAYRLQWALAEQAVKQGLNVFIDSPCNYQEALDQGSMLAERYGLAYCYVECKVDDVNLLEERLRTRKPMRSQRTGLNRPPSGATNARQEDDSDELSEKWKKAPCRPAKNAIILDSTGDLEDLSAQTISRITR